MGRKFATTKDLLKVITVLEQNIENGLTIRKLNYEVCGITEFKKQGIIHDALIFLIHIGYVEVYKNN